MTEDHGTYRRWLDVYGSMYAGLPGAVEVACPNCGQHQLRLVFTGSHGVGFASLWCDSCRWGIAVSRVAIPAGVMVLDPDLPEPERRAVVPNYRVVPPDEDDDDYEEVFPAE
jgi:hypothetical protein